jgi:hypothetical protein
MAVNLKKNERNTDEMCTNQGDSVSIETLVQNVFFEAGIDNDQVFGQRVSHAFDNRNGGCVRAVAGSGNVVQHDECEEQQYCQNQQRKEKPK